MKIWIDTDIGGDIDDAFALLLAASYENLEIIGVSTVFGNTLARAKIAKTLLQMSDRTEIPVYAGLGHPIKAERVFNDDLDLQALPKTYVKELFDKTEIENTDAVEAMKNALEKCEGDITFITIGALTNIAKLMTDYPEAANKIRRLYVMGAAEKLNLNEFNISCDPEAADIVFSFGLETYVTTLDVTFQCEMSAAQKKKLCDCHSDCVKTVMRMNGLWGEATILHDPLTLAVALTGDFVHFEQGNLQVELEGEFSRGKCVDLCDFNWKRSAKSNFYVSKEVDSKRFLDFYVRRICELDKKLQRMEKTQN